MKDNLDGRRPDDAPVESDDIEILEVVGVGEDGELVSGDDPEPRRGDDVEVVFDDGASRIGATDVPAVDPVARERLLRLQADFDNLRKRSERERDDHYRHATGNLTARLLPVLDNFERAITAGRQPGGIDALLEGVELVHRQFLEELRREGLSAIDALGQGFDPEVHEAVATDPASPFPPNTVVEVMQRGYFFHDRVLRPALVRVSVSAPEQVGPEDVRED